jgi:DNA-binding IclR family transcriptional regulator
MSKIVDRTLDFIELFATERRPLSLSDISRLLQIPVSSCHDVLHALLERGFLYEVGPRAGFYPTARLYDLARTIVKHDPVLLRAEILLRKLRDDLDESVSLAKAGKMTATYILVLEPSHPLRFLVEAGGKLRSLHATSAGKALLGSLPPDEFARYLTSATLEPMTSRTIRSKAALKKEIAESIRRGWFINNGESVEDSLTVSAHFTWNGSVYIVTVAGPTSRMKSKLNGVTAQLTAVCRQLDAPARD